MTVKRDYGSFSKAATQRLAPRIADLGYRKIKGGIFGRDKLGWVEGFFLQQSQWGSGKFRVSIGIHLPKLYDFYRTPMKERHFGLSVHRVVTAEGADHGDKWFPADDSTQLDASLEQVVTGLRNAERWFATFRSLSDVVDAFRAQNGGGGGSYGCLLIQLGRRDEAVRCLEETERHMTTPRWVDRKGTQVDPSTPGAVFIPPSEADRRHLAAVQDALRDLRASGPDGAAIS